MSNSWKNVVNSIVACGPCELERLHVIVVESDIPRAARLLSILRSLGIHHLSVVSGLQDLSLQLSQTQVDVLVTEIRAYQRLSSHDLSRAQIMLRLEYHAQPFPRSERNNHVVFTRYIISGG